MRLTSVGRSRSTMKSSPLSMNALTGPGTLARALDHEFRQLLPVKSGFCSEPDSANSFSMIFRVRMNQE